MKLANGEDIIAKVIDHEEVGVIMVSNAYQIINYIDEDERIIKLAPWLPRSDWAYFPIFSRHLITISAVGEELLEIYEEIVEEFEEEYGTTTTEVKTERVKETSNIMKHPKMNEETYKKLLENWQPPVGNNDSFMH
jgi:translation initiation factor 2 alpha subunit (eIF-2alpha)